MPIVASLSNTGSLLTSAPKRQQASSIQAVFPAHTQCCIAQSSIWTRQVRQGSLESELQALWNMTPDGGKPSLPEPVTWLGRALDDFSLSALRAWLDK